MKEVKLILDIMLKEVVLGIKQETSSLSGDCEFVKELGRYNSVIRWYLFVLVCVGTDGGYGVGINNSCKVSVDSFNGVGIGY
mgnify:CR=1 FL=1